MFADNKSQLTTGVTNANGLAFSNLTTNLWQKTTNRQGDAGHGISVPLDKTRDASSDGGQSWQRTTGSDRHGLAHQGLAEVVQQHADGPSVQRLTELGNRLDLDLDVHTRVQRLRVAQGRGHAAGRGDVVLQIGRAHV